MRSEAAVLLLFASTWFSSAALAQERVVGLLDLPAIFGKTRCDPLAPRPVMLHAEPQGARSARSSFSRRGRVSRTAAASAWRSACRKAPVRELNHCRRWNTPTKSPGPLCLRSAETGIEWSLAVGQRRRGLSLRLRMGSTTFRTCSRTAWHTWRRRGIAGCPRRQAVALAVPRCPRSSMVRMLRFGSAKCLATPSVCGSWSTSWAASAAARSRPSSIAGGFRRTGSWPTPLSGSTRGAAEPSCPFRPAA